ncbi:hypothetical protein BKA70DRAFT_1529036 [Coprinopsis sp. MPI-PUGE-AT-0042]|nr:hypothetical protein BKA70DRAFT_1529036 [Coprinopsis sp. MPI-PUGE-AT-0042]
MHPGQPLRPSDQFDWPKSPLREGNVLRPSRPHSDFMLLSPASKFHPIQRRQVVASEFFQSPTLVSSLEPYQMPIPSDIFNPPALANPYLQTSPPPAANADTIPALETEGEKDTHTHPRRPDLADPAFPRDGMAPWPYLAIAVIGIVLGVVVGYAMYSCWRSMSLVRTKSRAAKKGGIQGKEQGDECDEYTLKARQKDAVQSQETLTSPTRRKGGFIRRIFSRCCGSRKDRNSLRPLKLKRKHELYSQPNIKLLYPPPARTVDRKRSSSAFSAASPPSTFSRNTSFLDLGNDSVTSDEDRHPSSPAAASTAASTTTTLVAGFKARLGGGSLAPSSATLPSQPSGCYIPYTPTSDSLHAGAAASRRRDGLDYPEGYRGPVGGGPWERDGRGLFGRVSSVGGLFGMHR